MTPIAPSVYVLTIGTEDADQRIDNYLVRHLKGVPKGHIYRLLRKGEVRVNGGRKRADYRLQAGDNVRMPPVRVATPTEPVNAGKQTLEHMRAAILYQDERFLILNKPVGWAVHGGSGIQLGVVETLRQMLPECHFLELVHRLDRDTSGCLLLAKRRSALKILHELLRSKDWDKRYLALLAGNWQGGTRTVDVPLQKNVLRSGERWVRVDPEGKAATSIFTPLVKGDQWTLVSVSLVTGRTHQIRVHSAHIGHPIAQDQRYGDKQFNQWCASQGLQRMFLHADRIRIKLPALDRELKQSAPLDAELKQFLLTLGCDGFELQV